MKTGDDLMTLWHDTGNAIAIRWGNVRDRWGWAAQLAEERELIERFHDAFKAEDWPAANKALREYRSAWTNAISEHVSRLKRKGLRPRPKPPGPSDTYLLEGPHAVVNGRRLCDGQPGEPDREGSREEIRCLDCWQARKEAL